VLRLDLPQEGEYRVALTVRDPFGAAARAEIVLGVSNPPRFKRGDANGDGALDLSDAVSMLEALFLGGPAIGCLDAADANDDSQIDVTDAITSLFYQFLGGDPPPPPGPQVCGVDPTADGLAPCQEAAACR
jgi:hypothetical protein